MAIVRMRKICLEVSLCWRLYELIGVPFTGDVALQRSRSSKTGKAKPYIKQKHVYIVIYMLWGY